MLKSTLPESQPKSQLGDTPDKEEPKETQFLKRRGKSHSPPLMGRVLVYDPDTSRLNVRGRKDLENGMTIRMQVESL